MNRTAFNRNSKWIILANLLMAGCCGWSCNTDVRDAIWAGTLEYITSTTTDAITAVSPLDDLANAE